MTARKLHAQHNGECTDGCARTPAETVDRIMFLVSCIRDCMTELADLESSERRRLVRHGVPWTQRDWLDRPHDGNVQAILCAQAAAATVVLDSLPPAVRARMARTLATFATSLVDSMHGAIDQAAE